MTRGVPVWGQNAAGHPATRRRTACAGQGQAGGRGGQTSAAGEV